MKTGIPTKEGRCERINIANIETNSCLFNRVECIFFCWFFYRVNGIVELWFRMEPIRWNRMKSNSIIKTNRKNKINNNVEIKRLLHNLLYKAQTTTNINSTPQRTKEWAGSFLNEIHYTNSKDWTTWLWTVNGYSVPIFFFSNMEPILVKFNFERMSTFHFHSRGKIENGMKLVLLFRISIQLLGNAPK